MKQYWIWVYLVLGVLITHASLADSAAQDRRQNQALPYSVHDFVAAANQSAPMRLDDITRFEQVKALHSTLFFRYTILGSRADEIDSAIFIQELSAPLRRKACQQTATRKLLDSAYPLVYGYNDRQGRAIASIKIELKDC